MTPRAPRGNYSKLTTKVSAEIRAILHTERKNGKKYSVKKLKADHPEFAAIPQNTIYRIARQPFGSPPIDKRKNNKGRTPKITEKQKRIINKEVNHLKKLNIGWTTTELQETLDMLPNGNEGMSNSTFRRHIKKMDYRYLTARKKGLLTTEDKAARVKFARKIIKDLPTEEEQLQFWRSEIAMYTDIVGFEYKINPFQLASAPGARGWRKRKEGLKVTCKGSKEGKKTFKWLVGISYGRGVTMCKPILQKRMNGPLFAYIINEKTFETGVQGSPTRTIIQDNDPSQNSRKAMAAFEKQKINLFRIPARSPDINCIENFFNYVKQKIREYMREQKLTRETEEAFKKRITAQIQEIDAQYIDKLIDSYPKRINAIIQGKGDRTKY